MSSVKFEIFTKRIGEALSIRSQNELASNIGVNPSAITQARKKDTIPDKWILQLYRKYGLNPDWVERGIGPTFINSSNAAEAEFRQVPKVKARLCAGGGSFEVESEIEGYYSFRKDWLSRKGAAEKMVLLDIFGNSMEPEFREGDTVLIDESQKDVLAGAVYAVGIDDTIMVKRVEKHPKGLVLLSDNTKYKPIYMENEDINRVRIIGKVIWVCREFR
jgi:phage repressor protein C with HTH and peptisase S24 domain